MFSYGYINTSILKEDLKDGGQPKEGGYLYGLMIENSD